MKGNSTLLSNILLACPNNDLVENASNVVLEEFLKEYVRGVVVLRLNPRSATQGEDLEQLTYSVLFLSPLNLPRRAASSWPRAHSALKLRQSYKRCFQFIQSAAISALLSPKDQGHGTL